MSFFFYWHQVSKAFAPTIPKGTRALGKEFPASAPLTIQGEIKLPQSNGHKGAVALEPKTSDFTARP
jgi:hypothetical protein